MILNDTVCYNRNINLKGFEFEATLLYLSYFASCSDVPKTVFMQQFNFLIFNYFLGHIFQNCRWPDLLLLLCIIYKNIILIVE
jgi:hypothetical protein